MNERVNILLVDDQPSKLLTYEVILRDLDENLLKAASASEALEQLLKNDVAVVLIDVCMPELDGFQLAAMIREHPRFEKTAIIFISAVLLTDVDRLHGYEMGAVDYVPVPVIPEVLRAKVKVFAELYRKTRQLEDLNRQLEGRVAERTVALEASSARLLQSEQLRSLAFAAVQMGSWDWDVARGECVWDEGQHRIFGVDPKSFAVTSGSVRTLIHSEDCERLESALQQVSENGQTYQTEFRVRRPSDELRWCIGAAAARLDATGRIVRISGVTVDITDQKDAEERRLLLTREVDHRARNALAVAQSIVRLTQANSIEAYSASVEGRIRALSRAHVLLSESRWQGADLRKLVDEELAPYRTGDVERIITFGPSVLLQPAPAQTLALTLHELATNAAKYGALSSVSGRVTLTWESQSGSLVLHWMEAGGPPVQQPLSQGYGTKVVTAMIQGHLGGRAIFDWHREGLRCTLSLPGSQQTESSETAFRERRVAKKDTAVIVAKVTAGNRILLVEDEVLIAMMLTDALTEFGFEVVGPFGKMADAVAAAKKNDFHGAILDLNLGGESIYPLADILANRGIPFVFVTGYGAESIDGRFGQVPVLQKPIDLQALENIFVMAASRSAQPPRGRQSATIP